MTSTDYIADIGTEEMRAAMFQTDEVMDLAQVNKLREQAMALGQLHELSPQARVAAWCPVRLLLTLPDGARLVVHHAWLQTEEGKLLGVWVPAICTEALGIGTEAVPSVLQPVSVTLARDLVVGWALCTPESPPELLAEKCACTKACQSR